MVRSRAAGGHNPTRINDMHVDDAEELSEHEAVQ